MVIGFSEIGKIFNDSGTAANRVICMTCKKHYLIGTQNEVDSCEDCQKEKSGNLPEANRNAVLADVLELVQASDEIIELLHDRFANGYSGYRAFEKLKERADKVKRAHFS